MKKEINEIQKKTIDDALKKLKKHRKCLIVRPTGFGKTKMAVDILQRYKHAVYMYPSNNIKVAVKKYNINIQNIDLQLLSYCAMRNIFKRSEEFNRRFSKLNKKNTIFIMDEAHFIGAAATSKVILALMEMCPKASFLGITATPNRTDKLDIKWHFFNGITTYEYGLSDAFKDTIFAKPYYVYTPLDGTEYEKQMIKRIKNLDVSNAKKESLIKEIQKKIDPEKLNIKNLYEIINSNFDKFKNNINYYKFILFFTTYQDLHNKRDEIEFAFKKAFPKCEINIIIVSSENTRYKININSVHNLCKRKNCVDLIFNVNMLTFGYHVSDLTGIMMFRSTVSDIIYSQQVGRCLSVVQNTKCIIFDFVENLFNGINSIIKIEENYIKKDINKMYLFDADDIILDEKTKNILEIERLVNNAITEQFENEVVKAYKSGLVDIDYCLTKLQLHDKEDFDKILRRYKNE